MKVRFDKIGYPLYCDAGPYEGDMRIDLAIRLYLSPEEYARYEGSERLQITLNESGSERLQPGNTTELSGELPVSDIVAVGEAGARCRGVSPAQASDGPPRPATPARFPRKETDRP